MTRLVLWRNTTSHCFYGMSVWFCGCGVLSCIWAKQRLYVKDGTTTDALVGYVVRGW